METKLRAFYCFFIAIFLVLGIWVSRGSAQQDNSSCLNKLAPCLNYLNSGAKDPPDNCCDPLKSVTETEPACLCSLASNRGTRQAEQAGINVTEAQKLPGRCGQRVNPLSCLTNSPGSRNADQNSATKLMHVYSWRLIMISALPIIIAHIIIINL